MEHYRPWGILLLTSIIAHALIVLALAFWPESPPSAPSSSPATTQAPKQQKRTPVPSSRVLQASSQVRRISANRIKQKLENLREIEKRLAALEAAKKLEYNKSTESLRQNAITNAKGAMEEALGQQQKVVADLETNAAAYGELLNQYDAMLQALQMPAPLPQ